MKTQLSVLQLNFLVIVSAPSFLQVTFYVACLLKEKPPVVTRAEVTRLRIRVFQLHTFLIQLSSNESLFFFYLSLSTFAEL